MFCQLTFDDLPSATSSPGSEYGPLHSGPPDGPTTAPYGPDHPHANLSPAQAKDKGLLTSGTFGPIGSGTLNTRDLTRSLASKLRERMSGSILYALTWKESATPSGALKFQARASGKRTSAPALTGWRSPQNSDGEGGIMEIRPGCSGRYKLRDEALLAGWPTPVTFDAKESANPHPIRRQRLEADRNKTNRFSLNLAQCAITQVAFPTDSGMEVILLNGSIVAMKSGARLNPAHSRWLQAIPPQWDDYAPTETRSTLERRRSSLAPTWNASGSEEKDKP
jgi:hypothetical protein